MARFFSFRPSFTLESRERYGFRGWAGKPTHPPLTDFPVSCFLLAAVFDVASLVAAARGAGWSHDAFVAATWVQVAGLCTAVLAAVTGFLDRPAATPRTQARRTVNAHAAVMMTATVLALADLVLRVAGPASAGTPTYVAALGVVVAVVYIVLLFAPLQRRKRPAPVLPPGGGDPLPVTTSPAT